MFLLRAWIVSRSQSTLHKILSCSKTIDASGKIYAPTRPHRWLRPDDPGHRLVENEMFIPGKQTYVEILIGKKYKSMKKTILIILSNNWTYIIIVVCCIVKTKWFMITSGLRIHCSRPINPIKTNTRDIDENDENLAKTEEINTRSQNLRWHSFDTKFFLETT